LLQMPLQGRRFWLGTPIVPVYRPFLLTEDKIPDPTTYYIKEEHNTLRDNA